jgi:hypothetical protein
MRSERKVDACLSATGVHMRERDFQKLMECGLDEDLALALAHFEVLH